MHTTNYVSTLILVSEDTKAKRAAVPNRVGTVAALQHALLTDAPGTLTSDDLIIATEAERKHIPEDEISDFREEYFSKGQPCLRCSALVKTYGWGLYHDDKSRVSLVAMESDEYAALKDDPNVTKVNGMRSSRR